MLDIWSDRQLEVQPSIKEGSQLCSSVVLCTSSSATVCEKFVHSFGDLTTTRIAQAPTFYLETSTPSGRGVTKTRPERNIVLLMPKGRIAAPTRFPPCMFIIIWPLNLTRIIARVYKRCPRTAQN